MCCISFYSYIKPQLHIIYSIKDVVVYRSIPTSNRNLRTEVIESLLLYIVLFLHQTATELVANTPNYLLYIVLFLHQTATSSIRTFNFSSCISFYSYIKPQPMKQIDYNTFVVYRSIPTSNRNLIL